ncbi:ZIP family metal transporter [Luoshenia tenuis]|jgi:ZIP family zinc transporter|uniref:ZIP family metal transporter n=1 Tax=Luoshenia tenuis TaxID=2763654 RepID=UPI003D8B0460
METEGFSALLGAFSGIFGTGLGGLLAFSIRRMPGNRLVAVTLSGAAGLMLAVSCFDLLPGAMALGGLWTGVSGILLGAVCMAGTDSLLYHRQTMAKLHSGIGRTGLLMALGIAAHNLPEGLAIGSGMQVEIEYGFALAMLIALHDLPEGLILGIPLRMAQMGKWRVMGMALLAGAPTAAGAFIGDALGGISPYFVALCLSFAGGAMVYIICTALLAEGIEAARGPLNGLALAGGLAVGLAVAVLL